MELPLRLPDPEKGGRGGQEEHQIGETKEKRRRRKRRRKEEKKGNQDQEKKKGEAGKTTAEMGDDKMDPHVHIRQY